MAIHYAPEPANGASLVQQGFKQLAMRPDHPLARVAASEVVQLVQPHPVYDLRADEVAKGGGLSTAVKTGFRYLVQTDDQGHVAAGEVQTDSEGSARLLANINYGPYVKATADAVSKVQTLPQVGSGSYELRLLRFAAVYLVAIWLKPDHGDGDILYPLAPAPTGLEADRPYSEQELFQVIRPIAQKRTESKTPSIP